MKIPGISTEDGRKAWAFLAIVGGCMVFTGFAMFGVWYLKAIPGFTFWLALAAHVQVFVGMSALGWTLGRRSFLKVSRDGAELDDRPQVEGARRVEKAATEAATEEREAVEQEAADRPSKRAMPEPEIE